MPCSGLNSATSFTSGRGLSRSIVDAPSRARPVWFVSRPTRMPASALNPSARRTSMPASTGSVAGGATAGICDSNRWREKRASTSRAGPHVSQRRRRQCVAMRARSGVTSPLPSGCTRLDRMMTNTRVAGIDPDRRAREAGVAERADREHFATRRRIGRIDVPPEAAHVRLARRRRRRRHPRDRERRQHAAFVRVAPPLSHMRANFARSAAVLNTPACPATPPMRRAVGSCTTPRSIVMPGPSHGQPKAVHGCVGAMRGSQCSRRREHRLAHVERREDAFAHEIGERPPAHPRDDFAEQKEVDVAVDKPAARRIGQHFFARQLNRLVGARPLRPQIQIRPKPGHVRQQVANRDAVLAVFGEFRNERRDRIGQADTALFHQHHHRRRRGDHLGHRRQIEDCVERHRLERGLERAVAVRLPEHDRVVTADQDDGARHLMRSDGLGHHCRRSVKAGQRRCTDRGRAARRFPHRRQTTPRSRPQERAPENVIEVMLCHHSLDVGAVYTAAVLGAGTMGAQIAAHLANAGLT